MRKLHFLIGFTLVAVGCGSATDSNSAQVSALEARIDELEAELSAATRTSVVQDSNEEIVSSTSVSADETTNPVSLSRETFAALKSCHAESVRILGAFSLGKLSSIFEDRYLFEPFKGEFSNFVETCREARNQLDLDILTIGSDEKIDELYEKLQEFNLSFTSVNFLLQMSDSPEGISVYNWNEATRFPSYLLNFLDSYRP